MLPYWTAVQTQPGRADLALVCLAQQGYTTYAPRIPRERLVRGLPVETKPVLLFPNYIFVFVVDLWSPINSTFGVRRIVCDGSRPARVPDSVIEGLRMKEGPDGLIKLPTKPSPRGWRRGEKVYVTGGAFEGLDGLYQEQAPHERVRILPRLLGGSRVVELPRENVAQVRKR